MKVNIPTVAIRKSKINIGTLPYFAVDETGCLIENEYGERSINYHVDHYVDEFPLLVCNERLTEVLEINSFLIERRLGNFSLNRNKKSNESSANSQGYYASMKADPIDDVSILPIAKDMKHFLDWLINDGADYLEVIAAPTNFNLEEAKALLPIWRYQRHLVTLVKKKGKGRCSFKLARRRLQNLRAFYMWSYKRGMIGALPFSVKLKSVKTKRKDSGFEVFGLPSKVNNSKFGIESYVSNLDIPRTVKQKQDSPDSKLQPYNEEELLLLLQSDVAKHRTYGLFIKCAYMGGFRAFEIPQIEFDSIVNPSKSNNKNFEIIIVRKGHKPYPIKTSPMLMQALWDYTQDKKWSHARVKFESNYGMNNPDHPLPVFINKSGERMSEGSVKSTIALVRRELKIKNLPYLERDFHDLRATFATYMALFLIKKGYTEDQVKGLMLILMAHEDFDVTLSYINFSVVQNQLGKHGAMGEWVDEVYSKVFKRLEVEGEFENV